MEYLLIQKKKKIVKRIELKKFIEENSVFLKNDYLHYLNLLENIKIDKKKIRESYLYKKNYSLWEMSVFSEKNIYKYESISDVVKFLALVKICEKYEKSEIYLHNLDDKFAKKLSKSLYFSKKKIFFENINKTNFFDRKNIKKFILSNIVFSILFFLKNLKFNFCFKNQKKILQNLKHKDIFVISYFTHYDQTKFKKGFFYPLQWGRLFEKKNVSFNVFQIFIASKIFKRFSYLNTYLNKKNIHGLSKNHFINNFVDFKMVFSVINDFFLIRNRLKINRYKREINNPILKDIFNIQSSDFKISLGGAFLLEHLLWINIFDKIFKEIPKQKLGLFLYENQPWEHAFIRAWRLNGHGKIIGYTPTTVNFWHLNYFNHKSSNKLKFENEKNSPDLIACSSGVAYNFFKNFNIPIQKLRKVESLRYNEIKKLNHKKNAKKNFLILGDYSHEINKNMLKILDKTINKFKLYDKYNFYYKPHPATFVPKNLPKNFIVKNDYDLSFLLKRCKNVICSNSTSALIECYEYGNKVFLFNDIKTLDFSPIKSIKVFDFIKSFSNSNELYKIINLKSSQNRIKNFFYKGGKLPKWTKILHQFLS